MWSRWFYTSTQTQLLWVINQGQILPWIVSLEPPSNFTFDTDIRGKYDHSSGICHPISTWILAFEAIIQVVPEGNLRVSYQLNK